MITIYVRGNNLNVTKRKIYNFSFSRNFYSTGNFRLLISTKSKYWSMAMGR